MSNVTWIPIVHSNNNSLQPMSWNYTIQISTQINPNNNYGQIAKDFFEKYGIDSALSIANIENYYTNESLISLYMHEHGQNFLYEMVGHTNLKNKLSELGIWAIRYFNLMPTIQPVGKNSIMLSFYGHIEISGKIYNVESTIIMKISGSTIKITNQILNILL